MKHNINIILLFILAFLSSCTDVLDKAPDGNMQMDEVLSDPIKVEAFRITSYNVCYTKLLRRHLFTFGAKESTSEMLLLQNHTCISTLKIIV